MPKAQRSMRNAQRVRAHVCWALSIGLCALSLSRLAAQSSSSTSEGFSVSYLDRSVDACTDFYQFACGKWLVANPVPADRARYSRLNELADRNARIVRDILENAAFTASNQTPDEQKIGDAYAACMDQKTIEARRAEPLEQLLREIDAVSNREQLIRLAARFSHD